MGVVFGATVITGLMGKLLHSKMSRKSEKTQQDTTGQVDKKSEAKKKKEGTVS